MLNRLAATAAVFVMFFGGAVSAQQSLTAERVNKVGRGRYVAASDFRVERGIAFSQPDYKFESRLPEGFGRKTAQELGVGGKKFWNEYPSVGAALVVMHPTTVLIYDTVSKAPLYVTGCTREGRRGGLNRIKEQTPPPPPPPAPKPTAPPPKPEAAAPPPAEEPKPVLERPSIRIDCTDCFNTKTTIRQKIVTPPPPPEPRVEKKRRKWPWAVAAIGAGAVVGGVLATRGGKPAPSSPPPAVNKPGVGVCANCI